MRALHKSSFWLYYTVSLYIFYILDCYATTLTYNLRIFVILWLVLDRRGKEVGRYLKIEHIHMYKKMSCQMPTNPTSKQ